jgi:hypothetical protein
MGLGLSRPYFAHNVYSVCTIPLNIDFGGTDANNRSKQWKLGSDLIEEVNEYKYFLGL